MKRVIITFSVFIIALGLLKSRVVDIYDNYANNELVIELEKKEAE